MTKKKETNIPTKAESEDFEMLYPILESVFNEVKELSKKKQDGALNTLKVKMINRILERVKKILKNDPSVDFLDLLDEETLPTNSDSVLIITQFVSAMDQYKDKHYRYNSNKMEHMWYTLD